MVAVPLRWLATSEPMDRHEPLIGRHQPLLPQTAGRKDPIDAHVLEPFPDRFHSNTSSRKSFAHSPRKLPTFATAFPLGHLQLGSGYDYLQDGRMFCNIVGGVNPAPCADRAQADACHETQSHTSTGFLDSRLLLLTPADKGILVAVLRSAFGFLAAPAHGLEHMPEARKIILDGEMPLDQLGYPFEGP